MRGQRAFNAIKLALTRAIDLVLPNSEREFVLDTDDSAVAILGDFGQSVAFGRKAPENNCVWEQKVECHSNEVWCSQA